MEGIEESGGLKTFAPDEIDAADEGSASERPTTSVSPMHAPVSRAEARAPRDLRARPELRVETDLRSRAGERASTARLDFNDVYATHFHNVSRWVRAFGGLNADVDDLAQDVFLVVQRKLDGFQGENLAGWLYGIARKVVSDHRRRAWFRRWLRGVDPESVETRCEAPDASSALDRREAQRVVAAVLNELSAVRRSTFILFEIEGFSGEEIAALEGVPVNTVYTRLHHARKDFHRLMAARLTAGGEP